MDIKIIGELLYVITDPMYYDEEVIFYYDSYTKTYKIAKTLEERVIYEKQSRYCIDLILINRSGYDFVFTSNIRWQSRHYGQQLLQLILTDCSTKKLSTETLNIINNSISTTISMNNSLINN